MTEHGYLVISDISGYSSYLRDSELDHARESLSDLLNLLVEQTRSPLRIVEVEGDAVFSYAPAEEVRSAETLTSMIEDAYVAFRRALNLMVINTNCICKACRLLPTLDLKSFIHFGSYAPQPVADHLKLLGNDVNLIHRLLKNSVADATGLEAYAAYTEPAVEQLRLDREVEGFVSHTESYGDLGEVEMYVKDMHGVWEDARGKFRIRVTEEEAVAVFENHFELPPDEMWPYTTDPVTRNMLMLSNWQKLEPGPKGGAGVGAAYVCAHGDNEVVHMIVDWEPPIFYTTRGEHELPNVTQLGTLELVPEGEGSRLRLMFAPAQGPFPWRQIGNLIMFLISVRPPAALEKSYHALRQRIRQDQIQSVANEGGASQT